MGGAVGIRWRIPTTPDGRMPPGCLFSVAPTGLADIIRYRYPPLKRWAMVARSCGAGGADARALGCQAKSVGRQRLAQRFIAGQTAAKDKTSPVRDERGAVGTRLCAATVFRPHPCWGPVFMSGRRRGRPFHGQNAASLSLLARSGLRSRRVFPGDGST